MSSLQVIEALDFEIKRKKALAKLQTGRAAEDNLDTAERLEQAKRIVLKSIFEASANKGGESVGPA